MAYLDDLITARASVASKLADLMANPKPSYSIDGQSISWAEHRTQLMTAFKELNEMIVALDPYQYQSVVI